ncbi:MAG: hypothetical protein H6734_28210 [Alphaproteobacteria bacterium]|nr:hypothetical protein [Alphaproteobacteria bacterium]
MSRRVPRKDAPGTPHDEDQADDGGFDEVAFGGADPFDAGSLLGPVDEFTLSIPMEGTNPGLPPPIREEPQRPAPPARATPRPAPRVEPPRRAERPSPRPPVADPLTTGVIPNLDLPDPLTTGVVDPLGDMPPDPTVLPSLSQKMPRPPPPAPAISDATAALMLDGLDGDDVSLHLAEPSVGLPEVMMPPPDTARARPLRSDGKPPVISLEPQPSLHVDELDPSRPPPSQTPRPAASRAEAWRPAARARPEARPEARPRLDTDAVSLGGPPPIEQRPSPPPPARPEAPSTAAVQRLGSLLTLADEPPEREETLSSSLELLSLADEPPEREETIGAALVPMTPVDAPVRQPAAPRPAPAEDQVSLDDLELPPSSPPELPPVGQGVDEVPFGHMETRPISPEALAAALQKRPSAESHPPDAGAISARQEFVRPPHVKPLQTAQLRRETYRPSNGTTPPAPAAKSVPGSVPRSVPPPSPATPPPAPRAPPPEPASSPGSGLNAEPVLMWAATLIGMLILGSFAFLLLVLITYLV